MLAFGIIAGVLIFWFVLTTLVRFERGWVGIGPAQRIVIRWRVQTRPFVAAVESALEAVQKFGAVLERAGLLDPCPHCGYPPLDHARCSTTGCVVVAGSLPLRVHVGHLPRFKPLAELADTSGMGKVAGS